MFFEPKIISPKNSLPYLACRELFLAGQTIKAYETATKLRKNKTPLTIADYLLCGEISVAVGKYRQSLATFKLAIKHFPKSTFLQLHYWQSMAMRGDYAEAVLHLENMTKNSKIQLQPAINAILATIHAKFGFATRAKKLLDKNKNITYHKKWKTFINYENAITYLYLHNWEQAMLSAKVAVEDSPRWLKAKRTLASAYLSMGQENKAATIYEEGTKLNIENFFFAYETVLFKFSIGDFATALKLLDQYTMQWQKIAKEKLLNELLAYLHYTTGNIKQAQKLISKDSKIYDKLMNLQSTGKHIFLKTTSICQGKNMCVPTTVLMSAAIQGVQEEIKELCNLMMSNDGTHIWKMADVMKNKNFEILYIKNNPDYIVDMLQQGVPLIGELIGNFGGHVELILGYDYGLDIFFLRDPSSWIPAMFSREQIEKRYKENGEYLIALIPKSRLKNITIKEEYISTIGTAINRFAKACATGNREEAETTAKLIDDNSAIAIMKHQMGLGIINTPDKSLQLLKKYATNKNMPITNRINALFSLISQKNMDELLDTFDLDSKEFPPFHKKYVKLIKARSTGDWESVLEISQQFLKRTVSFNLIWIYYGEAQIELGDIDNGRKAIYTALELAPDSIWARGIERTIRDKPVSIDTTIKELNQFIQNNPDNHNLKIELADTLLNTTDGTKYENAILNAIHFMPRNPQLYSKLANWYLNQNREDLCHEILQKGRELMDKKYLPLHNFEITENKEETEPTEQIEQPSAPKNQFQTKLDQLRKEILEKFTTHPINLPAFKEIKQMHKKGQLIWHEVGQIYQVLFQATEIRKNIPLNSKILPKKLPGPKLTAIDWFLDICVHMELSRTSAKALNSWVQKQLKDETTLPINLKFNLAVIQELLGNLVTAEQMYNKIIQESPNFPGPNYRLANIYYKRQKNHQVIPLLKQELQNTPGHIAGLNILREIYIKTKKIDEALNIFKTLCSITPYSLEQLKDYLEYTLKNKGEENTINTIKQHIQYFPNQTQNILLAHIALLQNNYQKALTLLKTKTELPKLLQKEIGFIKLQSMLEEQEYQQALTYADNILKRFPNEAYFIMIKGNLLIQSVPKKGRKFLKNHIKNKPNDVRLIPYYLGSFEKEIDKHAIKLVKELKKLQKLETIDFIIQNIYDLFTPEQAINFLQWCIKTNPTIIEYKYQLALIYSETNLIDQANKTVDELLTTDPDNPNFISLKATIIQDQKPKQSIAYFKELYSKNGSVENLVQIATGYLIAREHQKAEEYCQKALQDDPTNVSALTNNIIVNKNNKTLYPNFCQAINQNLGIYHQYFHVTAVTVATNCNKKLPKQWLQDAQRRFEYMLEYSHQFKDEKSRLAIAIATWLTQKGKTKEAKKYLKHATWSWRLIKKFFWPGEKWIP